MESSRTKIFIYMQFAIFHIGVTLAIALSFIIPYAPELLTNVPFIIPIFQVLIGAACVIGILRIIRRIGSAHMRAISSPDDYFSLILLTVWFFFATFAVPNNIENGEGIMLTYFILTAFFLIYVPFSKISHYLYYPFTRYYLGKTLGYRGTYPIKHVPASRK
jgi:nitrate reductase gamma subunit